MRKTREEKAITLVALIITIVVLLILAVVAISAVTGDGIIQHAVNAKKEQAMAQAKEEATLAVNEWGTYKRTPEATTFFDFMNSKLGNTQDSKIQKVEDAGEGRVLITTKDGVQFEITETGVITVLDSEVEETPGGETGGEGEEPNQETWQDNGDGTYTKGTETVELGVTRFSHTQILSKLGITTYTGSYNGDWEVIGVEGNKLKLVSVSNVASNVNLGQTDEDVYVKDEAGNITETLKTEIVDLNGDGDLDFEKAMWSYNHAEEKLERIVDETTGEIGEKGNGRSITIEDINAISQITEEDKRTFNEQYGRTYRYYLSSGYICNQYLDYNEVDTDAEDTEAEGWTKKDCGWVKKYFISYDKTVIDANNQNNVVKLPHTIYQYNMKEKGLFAEKTDAFSSLISGDYWLNSKSIKCTRMSATFCVRCKESGGRVSSVDLLCSDGSAYRRRVCNQSRGSCYSLHLKS